MLGLAAIMSGQLGVRRAGARQATAEEDGGADAAPRRSLDDLIDVDQIHVRFAPDLITSVLDPAVGLVLHKKVGDAVETGECLVTLHVNQSDRLAEAESLLADAFVIAPAAPSRPRPLVLETLS